MVSTACVKHICAFIWVLEDLKPVSRVLNTPPNWQAIKASLIKGVPF